MPYPPRPTQSDPSKRTGNVPANKTPAQYYADLGVDPSVKPGTPQPQIKAGTIITTVGPANNSIWAMSPARHAAGVPVVAAACYPKGNKALGGVNMGVTKVLSYTDTQNPSVTKKYTFVNQSVKIKGPDGNWLFYRGYYVPKIKPVITKPKTDNKHIPDKPSSMHEYRWNLPPHKWSLPLLPTADPNFMPDGYGRPPSQDRYRRGRLWWKSNDPNLSIGGSSDNTKNASLGNASDTHMYGFQFLWNPESFTTSVAVNLDATPSAQDRFIGGPGYFPATETFSIKIRIDRTNDFACAASMFDRPTWTAPLSSIALRGSADANDKVIAAAKTAASVNQNFVDKAQVKQFIKYYRVNGSFAQNETDASIQEKLIDLYQRGTLADLEFLLRAINGSGPGSSKNGKPVTWANGRGIATADIGFLIPTVLNIDIGPLAYQGYVNSLSVEHGAFTQDMIPIRTDLTISFTLLATVGLTAPAIDAGK
ncbi:hypothetical protein UFOVP225_10 [uncultured Caudovirales phage]|uniref:Uncharacterized protein n=1 Tax=uncultured Caudovirales phage TaxID=2100421 RepID=A0A6J7WQG3_9CAUD|nr:hypothetical protein UFOVP113_23 [uncultured Caudovirales phage]CAB5218965.1 hypothetical protein UFOVP225_10 [uncultured Caudovirales phage]